MAKKARSKTFREQFHAEQTSALTNEDVSTLLTDVKKAYGISRDRSVNRILERVIEKLSYAQLTIPE